MIVSRLGDPPVLRTERVVLTPVSARHVDALHAQWTDPRVRRYLWDDRIIDREEVEEVVDASIDSFAEDGYGLWAVSLRWDDEEESPVVGFCGFRREPESGEVELLYGLDPGWWGGGLATEAAEAALAHAFGTLRLERVIAGTDAPNRASLRVMRRLGMRPWRRFFREGLAWEQIYAVLTAAEFHRRRRIGPPGAGGGS